MNDKDTGVSQSSTQNGLLLFACTILTGLAVYSVVGGLCDGLALVVVSSLSAILTFVGGLAVVLKGKERASYIEEGAGDEEIAAQRA